MFSPSQSESVLTPEAEGEMLTFDKNMIPKHLFQKREEHCFSGYSAVSTQNSIATGSRAIRGMQSTTSFSTEAGGCGGHNRCMGIPKIKVRNPETPPTSDSFLEFEKKRSPHP